jgi:hypothetical protein
MNIDGLCASCGFGPGLLADGQLFALVLGVNLTLAALVLALLRLTVWLEER